MIFAYKHNHGKEQAYEIIEDFLGELQEKYSDGISKYSKKWNASKDKVDFKFKFKKHKIEEHVEGHIKLTNDAIVFDPKLPFGPENCLYKEKIESKIKEELDKRFLGNIQIQGELK